MSTDEKAPWQIGYQMHRTVDLTVDIVAGFVAHNSVPAAELSGLIRDVHAALVGLGSDAATVTPELEVEKPTPAQIRKSITPDALTSFIDGKSYKTLKRHLGVHGLEPHSYRQRYGLPNDYPMVASAYAEQRSQLAKSFGLGRPALKAVA